MVWTKETDSGIQCVCVCVGGGGGGGGGVFRLYAVPC